MATIIESPTPYEILSISYNVPSATQPGTSHTVTVTDSAYTCDCEASRWPKTRGKCWHIKAVRAGSVTGKPKMRIRWAPAGNPSAWLYEA